MKQFLTILLLSLIGFTACRHHTAYPLAMQQAEQLMSIRPDSALTLLQGMADTLATLPEETRMYHQLLTIQAKDKQYITHTSDSLINRIVSFYEEYGNSDRLMMAYFYQGSTYRDMNDAPRALKAFHQAIDAGKETRNLILLGQAYGQMGTLFTYQHLYNEALESNQKAFQYYNTLKDSIRFPLLIRNMARIYSAKGNNDSALFYYKKAYQLATEQNLYNQRSSIIGEMGCTYFNIGKTDTAKVLLTQSLSSKRRMANVLSKLALIYQQEGKTDSAQTCLKEALAKGNVSIQCYAYLYLSQMETEPKKSAFYKEQYEYLKDSLASLSQSEAIAKYHLLYRFQRSEREKDMLNLTNEKKQSQIYLLLLTLSIAIFLIAIVFFFAWKKKQELLIQAEKFRRYRIKQEGQNRANIKENKEKIKELECLLLKSEKQKDNLHNLLLTTQKELLEIANKQSEIQQENRQIQNTIFYKSDIYKHFQKAGFGIVKVTSKDWETLENTIESYYLQFSKRLYELYPSMNDRELKVCLLIKTNIPIKDISNILNCNPSTISKIRKRLYTKITGQIGSGKELDKFIIDL